MFQLPETPDAKCFAKAVARKQETFTLVEQDLSAQFTLLMWVVRNWECGVPTAKLREAVDTAFRWRDSNVVKKYPD